MRISHLTIYPIILCVAILSSAGGLKNGVVAQESAESKKKTVEPVFRVPKIKSDVVPDSPLTSTPQQKVSEEVNQSEGPVARVADAREINASLDKKSVPLNPELLGTGGNIAHPLDRAVEIARNGLSNMRENIFDYSAMLVKRERVDNKLSEANYMKIKIRNPRVVDNRNVPFSVYMKFLKPRSASGREVIWVDGQNNNNLIAHEMTPLLKFRNFYLEPNGVIAMRGNRYPIYDAGLENLTIKLIEKAERDRAAGVCEVKYREGASIRKRPCSVIEVVHHERKLPYEFHIAKVYIDDELQIPVRFVSYDWPQPGCKPRIMEEYTYVDVKVNVGLTDEDFNIANPLYNFAK